MADNGCVPSRSPASENDSSEQSPRSFATLSGGSSVMGGASKGYITLSNKSYKLVPTTPAPAPPLPPPSSINGGEENLTTPPSSNKRPRGRPPGSKNKPKPPIFIREDNDKLLKSVIIEIPSGNDIIESIIAFARHRRVCISVLSGSGLISDVTLHHPLSRAPVFPIQGSFNLLSLTGTYITGRFPSFSSSSSTDPPCSSFGISLCGSQGQVFGGTIGGKVIAAGVVVVVASIFKNPEHHRAPFMHASAVESGENNHMYAGVINANVGGDQSANNNDNNNNNMPLSMSMSGFGVAVNSSTSLNGRIPPAVDVNLMQWNHPAPHHQFN